MASLIAAIFYNFKKISFKLTSIAYALSTQSKFITYTVCAHVCLRERACLDCYVFVQ